MIVNTNVRLDKEDNIKHISFINNFGNMQFYVMFESGNHIYIDKVILDQINEQVDPLFKR